MSKLDTTDEIVLSDKFVLYQGQNCTYAAGTASALLSFLNTNLSFPEQLIAQAEAPTATGFTVNVNAQATWLILTPSGAFAAGTIALPVPGTVEHGTEVLVNVTQDITALTVDGQGAVVTGAPTSITAPENFRLKYYQATNTWYRIA